MLRSWAERETSMLAAMTCFLEDRKGKDQYLWHDKLETHGVDRTQEKKRISKYCTDAS